MKKISKEDLLARLNCGHLTVGDLKKFLVEHNIPDDAIVLSQRVEDVYFDNLNWRVYLKETYETERYRRKFPEISQEEIDQASSQYVPVWCPVFYSDDPDILFLDLHY